MRVKDQGTWEGLDGVGAGVCKRWQAAGGPSTLNSAQGCWESGDFVILAWGPKPLNVLNTLGGLRGVAAAVCHRKGVALSPHGIGTPAFSSTAEAGATLARYFPKELEAVVAEAVGGGTPAVSSHPTTPSLDMFWVTHFPLFEEDPGKGGNASEQGGGVSSAHHPFTAPSRGQEGALLRVLEEEEEEDGEGEGKGDGGLRAALAITAAAYDLVANGSELGGGSLRIHASELQRKVLRKLKGGGGGAKDDLGGFEGLLQGLEAGAPPHGGFALGLDRLCMLLAGPSCAASLRDVMAFPKSATGADTLCGAPSVVSDDQLFDVRLALTDDKGAVRVRGGKGGMQR